MLVNVEAFKKYLNSFIDHKLSDIEESNKDKTEVYKEIKSLLSSSSYLYDSKDAESTVTVSQLLNIIKFTPDNIEEINFVDAMTKEELRWEKISLYDENTSMYLGSDSWELKSTRDMCGDSVVYSCYRDKVYPKKLIIEVIDFNRKLRKWREEMGIEDAN